MWLSSQKGKKMKLPSKNFKVKIGPFDYDVIYSQDTSEQSSSYASISHSRFKIFIDPTMPAQRQVASFWHEILHGFFDISGLYRRFEEKAPRIEEEDITTSFGILLYQFIEDNPFLFK